MQEVTGDIVAGSVDPRFAVVEEAFRANFSEHGEIGAAFAAEVEGTLVVDLWGGVADQAVGRTWERDTLVPVYSTTKGLAAIAVAMLVDRGRLAYDQPVARSWPEFSAGDKSGITVAHLLSHQAGLCALDEPLTLATVADLDGLATLLAAQRPRWRPGEGHGYHAVTFGFYAGELVRRVDGRTLGTFLREEVTAPRGADVYIGLPAALGPRVATVVQAGLQEGLSDPTRPIVQAMMDPSSLTTRAMFAIPELAVPGAIDRPDVRGIEIPSANGIADARSLAIVYGALANGESRLCRPDTLQQATATAVDGEDLVLFERTAFGMGFMKPATSFFAVTPNAESFGHPGNGGSLAFGDPVARLGAAYVTNSLQAASSDRRASSVLAALYDCL